MMIVIFYEIQSIFKILGYFLPLIPLFKIGIGCWILLPQSKGEFYLYHALLEYLLYLEAYILKIRSDISSAVIRICFFFSKKSLELFITFLNEECIVKT